MSRDKNKKGKSKVRRKIVCNKPQERIHPEDSEWYPAIFEDFEFKEGNYYEQIIMKYKITDGELEDGSDADGALISFWGKAEFNHGDQTYDSLCVLMDEEIEIDDEVDLDAAVGTEVEILASVEKQKNGKFFSKVKKIRLPKKAKKKKKAAPSKSKKSSSSKKKSSKKKSKK